MQLLTTLVLCRPHGMMECWNHGPDETEKKVSRGKKKSWSKTHNFSVWIKVFGINFHCFTMNALISTRDDHPFSAIMALPDKWLSLFDVEKLFKAQDTTSWPTALRENGIDPHDGLFSCGW
jgi:hypothetical protein